VLQLLPMGAASAFVGQLLSGAPVGLPRVTVASDMTIAALLSIVPPIAIFLGLARLGLMERRRMAVIMLYAGAASATLGLVQVSQGPSSPLRWFENTNTSEAVGFFANRNHLAALLCCSIVMALPWVIEAARLFRDPPSGERFDTVALMPLLWILFGILILLAAIAVARSRAGFLFAMVALGAGYLLLLVDRRRAEGPLTTRVVFGVLGLAVLIALQLGLYRVLSRFELDQLQDARFTFSRLTSAAAQAVMPFGAGIGSFADVYGAFERPADALLDTFANRAHNDILEVWLETGVLGMVLAAVFVVWLLIRLVAVWKRQAVGYDIDHAIARAAGVCVVLLLLHSLVDYPLRTGSGMAVMAAACGFLVPAVHDRTVSEVSLFGMRRKRRSMAKPKVRSVADRAPGSDAPVSPLADHGTAGRVGWPRADHGVAPADEGMPSATAGQSAWPETWRTRPTSTATTKKPDGPVQWPTETKASKRDPKEPDS
jgi:O-antigen ligase